MWVIKIGGHLLEADRDSLLDLIQTLAKISRIEPICVVAGGGTYADCIRALDRKYSIGPAASHWTATLATHLSAYRLASMGQALFALTNRIAFSAQTAIPLILPLDLVRRSNLPQSWEVTSDSIAAFVASRSRSNLLIVKTVDGVIDPFPGGKLLQRISADDLSHLKSSPVDRYLPVFLSVQGIDAWLANGLHPNRLESIVKGQDTVCTHILP